MVKTHLAVMRIDKNDTCYNDTLCGRESGNVAEPNRDDQEKVTCKICLKIIANKNHWLHKKWLAKKD